MKLDKYTNEIHAIAKANGNPQFSTAVDMFLNNIKDAGNPNDQYHYAGADELDYEALKPDLADMEDEKNDYIIGK